MKEIEVDTFESNGKTIFVKRELRFIDSFKFMATSLDSLANNLLDNMFNNLSYFYEEQAKLKLLKRKSQASLKTTTLTRKMYGKLLKWKLCKIITIFI